jgi:DNA-binding transcriptional regulator GbsR (MarR family)
MLNYLKARKTPCEGYELAKRFKCSYATVHNAMKVLGEAGLVHKHFEVTRKTGGWRASKVWFFNSTEKLPNVTQRRKVEKEETQFAFHNPFGIGARV